MKRMLTVVFALLLGLSAARADKFEDTFEKESADAGPPISYSVYGESVMDRGVTALVSFEGKQSAYVVCDFALETWGAIMLHDPFMKELDLSGKTLSVQVRANADFSGKQGVVGLKLIDADGTGCRTMDDDLLCPDPQWQMFSQKVDELTYVDEDGEEPGLDLEHILQYGIVFFDRGDVEKTVTFGVDDFKGK